MGTMYQFSCGKCGHVCGAWLGWGGGYFTTLEKSITSFKAGEHGEFCQLFFQDNPEGMLDCSYVLLQCKTCKALDSTLDYAMYSPVNNDSIPYPEINMQKSKPRNRHEKRIKYIDPFTLHQKYELYSEYDHCCRECGGAQRIIRETFDIDLLNSPVYCPKCNAKMIISEVGCWD